MFWESKILIYSCLKRKTDVSKTAKTVVNFEEQDKQGTFHLIFTTQKGSRFFAWNCWKKHECKQIYFVVYFLKLLNFWLDFCFIDYGEFVSFVHYSKTRKPEKVFFLSHPSVTVSYSVTSILLLFLLPSKELPVRIKMNKQKSSSKLFSQFSPTPVRSLVLLMFSKWCHYFARLLPSPYAGLQLVTQTSHRRKNITWTRTFPKFCLQGDRL